MKRIRIIAAKYRGSCGYCRRPINPGDLAGYDGEKKRTLCYPCAEAEYEGEALKRQMGHLEQLKIA